jgi:membrane-associated phospholipid phosphatase
MAMTGPSGAPVRATTLVAAAGIGASRVCLGVHWPSDVVAGWLFAEGWLCLTTSGEGRMLQARQQLTIARVLTRRG